MQMIYLGCAGWAYNHWRGPFYPSNLASELEFYAQYSPLNEINSTFYRIPTETMVRGWYYYTPDNFIFSAKLTRDITHASKRKIKLELIKQFYARLKMGLEEKFKITLVQFPPWLKYSPDSFKFLTSILDECISQFDGQIAVEIRDESWLIPEFKDYLDSQKIALTQTTRFPLPKEFLVSDREFHYVRLLGDRKLIPNDKLGKVFLDKKTALSEWVTMIVQLSNSYDTIFVLINNRFSGYAINDAITLNKALTAEKLDVRGFERSNKYLKRQMTLQEFFS
ncbi:hypothetical protein CEE45_15005 [Candidatus Heimdallarchaeota archaeon B3_Heim]|nr:MAG: hypothetical protein CEE45_15005 [Candidatus Heimdallarchaeota archaeon B3_Heim]